ncbi:MAG: carboxypeptidase regulatory-like domain-containing protein [Firmicutes bacterium]|nr:carboxypeptidase regulatory-like domain-containing protein [Bacillota bacterium]
MSSICKFKGKHTGALFLSLLLIISMFVFQGCNSGGSEGGSSATGVVSGIVTTGSSAIPLSNVLVSIGTISSESDTNGSYQLTGVTVGSQTISATRAGFDAFTATVEVVADQTTELNITMTPDSSKGTVVGTVTDASSGSPIEAATVTIGSNSTTTNEKGHFLIGNLTTGTYSVSVIREGYTNYSDTINVVEKELITKPIKMTPLGEVGSVSGTVQDSQSGISLEDVNVAIGEISTLTDADGHYLLTGIATGSQTLTASRIGYNLYSSEVTVQSGQTTTLDFTMTPLSETGAAAGLVTDSSSGFAISEAEVTVGGITTLSNEEGLFFIEGVPSGDQTISAVKSGFINYSGTIAITAGQVTEQAVTLEPSSTGGTVMGLVTDSVTGLPVDGVQVTIGSVTDKTNVDGSYILSGVNAGVQTITGEKFGYIAYNGEVEVLANEITFHDFQITPEATSGTVSGFVTDSSTGAELEDVEVSIGASSAKTDEEGYYQLEGIEAGSQTITAKKNGYQDYSGTVEVVAGDIVFHDISMTSDTNTGSVTGIAYDQDTGETIKGVWISTGFNITRTHSDGTYRIDGILAGTRKVYAIKHAYNVYSGSVEIKAGQTVVNDIPLKRFSIRGNVTGQVTDAETGADLENAFVTVGFEDTLTNNAGRYYISGLVAGLKIVTCLKPGYYPFLGAVYVNAGSTVTYDISLTPFVTTGTVQGTVTDSVNLEPLEDVRVEIAGISTETDNCGNYDIDGIEAGIHHITAVKNGYNGYSSTVSVTAGETTIRDISLVAKAEKGMVAGIVTNSVTGLPIHNVTVSIDAAETQTDIFGYYMLTGIKAGARSITAHKHGFLTYSSTVQVVAGRIVINSFQMTRRPTTGDLAGIVISSATGLPIEGARISCNDNTTFTDQNGSYYLQGIEAGDRYVTAEKSGYQFYSVTVSITAGLTTTQNMSLNPIDTKGSVEGTVTDTVFNEPIEGVYVEVEGKGGGHDHTNESGFYRISGIEAGDWKIRATVTAYQVYNNTVTVTASQKTTFSFQMTPLPGSGTLTGTVTDATSGSPVSGALVSIGDRITTTNSNGVYRFRHVTPASYDLTAIKRGYKGYLAAVSVIAGTTTTYNFQMTQGN